jgi:ribulose-5-phosphate 4-epimerase/fuculose-1-phosphate aldolase
MTVGNDVEWAARVELAALHRLVDFHFGCGEGIYNHISLRLPDQPDSFLIKPHVLLHREVTASNLIKVTVAGQFDESSGVNGPGYALHGGILMARPDVNCAIHLHSNAGLAISALSGGLKMYSQNALRFYRRVGYHAYQGIVEDLAERPAIAAALGADNVALILRNHGLVTVGGSARDAFENMRDLTIACETQVMIQSTGAEAPEISDEICRRVAQQYVRHDAGRGRADWPAWLRLVESLDPSYKR